MTIWSQLTNLDNPEDIKSEMTKKYRNTILKIVNDKHVTYARYTGVDKAGYHVFRDLYDNEIKLSKDTDVDIRIWYPRRGLYNIESNGIKRFVYFARTANRQYRRGINEDNTNIIDPCFSNFSLDTGFYGIQILCQIAENKHDYRHLDEILKLLKAEDNNILSYAINDRWGVSAPITNEADKYPVYLYRRHVANIIGDEIVFNNKIFIQELIDEKNKDWYGGYSVR